MRFLSFRRAVALAAVAAGLLAVPTAQAASTYTPVRGTDFFASDGVCLIEWADRIAGCLPREHLLVQLEVTGEESRQARIEGRGRRYEEIALSFHLASPGPQRP